MTASLRCWFCGREDVRLTDEHVLSQANFGGRLVAPNAICERCNSRSGELEDQLARSVGVAERVGLCGDVIDRRRPRRPQTDGVLRDGNQVTVEFGSGGLAVRDMKPRLIATDADGTEVWEVAEGQEEMFVARRRGRGQDVRVVGRPLTTDGGLTIRYGLGPPNFDLWPRLAAKVTLSLASMVVDPSWLDTPGARALQHGFWRSAWDQDLYPRGVPWQFHELPPTRGLPSSLQSAEHVLALDIWSIPGSTGTGFVGFLS